MPTIEVRIATGADDVEERASGTMDRSSSDLELVLDGNVQTVGLRFLGIDIPQGAVITSAYIQFQTDEVTTGAASLLIRGEDTGDAAAFTSAAFNASSRLRTDASVGWNPDAWSTIGEVGLAQRTPDITAIVQEIVGRSDWAALSDMVLLITGSGKRTAEAFESGAATAPLLHIEYDLSGPPVVGNLSINDVSVAEGNNGTSLATFTVSRTGTAAFSVDYATGDGSATAGSDYAALLPTTLDFAEGETSKTISVAITGETDVEGDETFFVNLSNAVGPGANIVDDTGVGTILDDDTPSVVGSISINDVSVTEGNNGTSLATFTVSRTGTAAFSVDYATGDGSATAGSDYAAIPQTTLNFAEGETAKTISVAITGETAVEDDETFLVSLSNAVGPGASIVDDTGVGTILNDDTPPVVGNISIGDVSVSEGDSGTKLATFTVTRTGGTAAFTVNYATANGSATAGSDYVAVPLTTLDFAEGETARTVSVTITGDTAVESDENFLVNLSNAVGSGATVTDGSGAGTILNDDTAPVVGNISINDVSVSEGNSGTRLATFTVSRTGGTAAFSVNYATTNGSATAGSDYVALPSTTLNFAAGDTAKTISVTINGDTTVEGNETFNVNLSNAVGSGASITDATGVGTILNDDAPVVGNISINDVSVSEGNSGTKLASFTVSRTGTAAFSVNYATANGSATAGSDYVALSSTTLNFAAGETAKTISVMITGDTVVEGNETFSVNLTNPVGPGASIADGTGVGTILNDDVASTGPVVRNIWSTTGLASPYGSPDPSGLAYVPGKGMFLCDSEVNESPFNSNTAMFLVQLNDGAPLTRIGTPYNLKSFTIEPTGLAYVPSADLLFISDDDADKMFWVDPDNPQVKLGEFRTALSGPTDAEDVAYDGFDGDANGGDGHLYIANGVQGNIREVTTSGTLVRTISLPSIIEDPEALVWDDVHNVFFVGGKFSAKIWVVDRNGAILDTISLLTDHRRPNGSSVNVTDVELAPSSNPNDDPARLSLYVADYGKDNFNDGRLFEIDLGDFFFV